MKLPTQRFEEEIYATLRFVTGFLFMWHGTQKLFVFPVSSPFDPPAYIVYVAGPIELIGGLFIAIGLFTRWTSFLCSGLMAFAYWIAHGYKAILPIENHGELAVLYCFIFSLLCCTRWWKMEYRHQKRSGVLAMVAA